MKKILVLLLFSFVCKAQNETTGFLKSQIKTDFELSYILNKPDNYKSNMPLIIYLHGSGEKGSDLQKIKSHGPLKYLETHKLDCFVLAPQCPDDKYWDSDQLYILIKKIVSENKIDPSRIYLTGLSMGAWGCWNLAYKHPELFAALVPIAGYVDRIPMIEECKIANIPIRMFHGLLDDVVNVDYSIVMYKRLQKCNKNIKLEIFDDAWHDSWTRVYENPEIYKWMLDQKKIL
ncbi:dienelactone hydrolase family protein [Flavobacterium sp. Arc3]|uniref:carboxylesterase family protein n=1 Tax=Flavobacterium sp. Arc3 TaxID=3046686 RepID=UPI00352DB4FC